MKIQGMFYLKFFNFYTTHHWGGVSLRVASYFFSASAEPRARVSLPSTPTKAQLWGEVQREG